jgi:hypothetical protein
MTAGRIFRISDSILASEVAFQRGATAARGRSGVMVVASQTAALAPFEA